MINSGYSSPVITGTLTSSGIRSKIANGKGIIAGCVYASGGHMVVICGHDNGAGSIEVMVPSYGAKIVYSYSYFSNNSQFNWIESLY